MDSFATNISWKNQSVSQNVLHRDSCQEKRVSKTIIIGWVWPDVPRKWNRSNQKYFFHIFIHKNQFLSIVLLLSKNKLLLKSANYFRKKSSITDVRLGSKHNSALGYRTRISGTRFEVLVWQTCVGYKCIAFLDPPTGSEGKKFNFCKFLQSYY